MDNFKKNAPKKKQSRIIIPLLTSQNFTKPETNVSFFSQANSPKNQEINNQVKY